MFSKVSSPAIPSAGLTIIRKRLANISFTRAWFDLYTVSNSRETLQTTMIGPLARPQRINREICEGKFVQIVNFPFQDQTRTRTSTLADLLCEGIKRPTQSLLPRAPLPLSPPAEPLRVTTYKTIVTVVSTTTESGVSTMKTGTSELSSTALLSREQKTQIAATAAEEAEKASEEASSSKLKFS